MSELVNDWWERRDHPLLNNVILDIVFKHLRKKDLMRCRMVCKAWNLLTIPFTRNAFEIMLCWHDADAMENFVGVLRSNNLGIPFARFRLDCFCLTEGVIGQEFLQLCGDTIQSIRCFGSEFTVEDLAQFLNSTPKLECFETPSVVRCRNSESVINLFPEVTTKPKLTSLTKLSVCDHYSMERNVLCPTYLEELITTAENISTLHLVDLSTLDEMDEGGIETRRAGASLEVLSLMERLGRESSIQELTISNTNTDYSEYFALLHKMVEKPMGLKLKKFAYNMRNSEEWEELFQIIPYFKDTLENLKISGNYCSDFTQLPKMRRLTKLSIHLAQDFNSRVVNLNGIFPVLEELELDQFPHYPHENLNEFFPESEPCPLINSLELRNIFWAINGIKQAVTIFPNLTRLTMNIDSVWILREIWSQMTQLKCLSISGTIHIQSMDMDGLDSYLTGSHEESLRRIGHVFHHMEGMTSDLGTQHMILKLRTQYCQLPSIVHLTELKSLTLNLVEKRDRNRPAWKKGLTDFTGYLGLYSMKRLKHLKIYNCEFTKVCCEMLRKELGLESWSFQTSQNTHIIPSELE